MSEEIAPNIHLIPETGDQIQESDFLQNIPYEGRQCMISKMKDGTIFMEIETILPDLQNVTHKMRLSRKSVALLVIMLNSANRRMNLGLVEECEKIKEYYNK